MDRVINFIVRRSALVLAVSACLLVAFIMFVGHGIHDGYANDFRVYWRTANLPYSRAYEFTGDYPFPYPPTMLLWIKPLSLIGLWPAYILWVVLSVLAFTWSNRKYLTAEQNLVALISVPVVFCLLTGQVSVALAAIMLWAFGTNRKFAAGVTLGIVATIKPQLVIMAPFLLLFRRDFRVLVGAVASFMLVLIIALVAFGFQPWIDWLGSFDKFRVILMQARILRAAANPAAQAEWWGFSPLPFLIIGFVFAIWLVHRCKNLGPLETTAVVGTASIFAAPYSLTYDLAVIVPFLAVSVVNGRITSAVAISATLPPLPIIMAAFELVRATRKADRETLAPLPSRPNFNSVEPQVIDLGRSQRRSLIEWMQPNRAPEPPPADAG